MERLDAEAIAKSPALKSLIERMKGLAPEEIERRLSSPQPGELSDEELALFSGGNIIPIPLPCAICGKVMPVDALVAHWVAEHSGAI